MEGRVGPPGLLVRGVLSFVVGVEKLVAAVVVVVVV
jgi:hypothetical protein